MAETAALISAADAPATTEVSIVLACPVHDADGTSLSSAVRRATRTLLREGRLRFEAARRGR